MEERALWEQTASHYDQVMAPRTGLFTERLVEAVELRPGERVLDAACGPGGLTHRAAQAVAPGGWVVGLDFAMAMARLARAGASAGSGRLSAVQGDAERLPFRTGAFDAAACQFGLMMCPRPAVAAAELRRALRPGGRAGILVWAAADRMPYFHITSQALRQAIPGFTPPPGPGPCSLGAPGALESALAAAGLSVEIHRERRTWTFESVDSFWADMTRGSRTMRQVLGERDADTRARVEAAWRAGAARHVQPGGAVVMEVEALLAVARAIP
ncbi:MAG TPA: methyltransferase domain-containing protein [Myxococcaceae bacterium]|nr:methyltransferase domain-containing protein [Myxococcaceae bacterium]